MTLNDYLDLIDAKAGAAREYYITCSAGQSMTYMLKASQAQACVANNYATPLPAFIQAEMAATGTDAPTCCANILQQQDQWIQIGAQIEQIRRTQKLAIAALAEDDLTDAEAIYLTAVSQLAALMPSTYTA